MKNPNNQVSSWSSSSYIFLWVMVPLVLVSGFFCLFGPTTSTWVSPWIWSSSSGVASSSSSSSSSKGTNNYKVAETMTYVESKKKVAGLQEIEAAVSEVSTFNLSSSSTPAKQVVEVHIPDGEAQKVLLGSISGSDISLNTGLKPRRSDSKLEKLEAGLAKSRAAIREAAKSGTQIPDTDYIPQGPMYHNSGAFQRSYLEMEKQFKVFVYEEGEPPLFHNGPCKSIYSSEGNFIQLLEVDQRIRTRDPEKAHVYFLPFSVTMMVQYVYEKNSHDLGPIKQTVLDYVNTIGRKYPYWNRSLGADHFTLACHDWGPTTSSLSPYMLENSIRALCNANTSEGFRPSKDVSFPEINLVTGDIRGWIGGPSPSHRPILAFFAGGLHGPIRPILLEHWKNKDSDIQVYEWLPRRMNYNDMMKKSKFCICPSGYEVASPRIVEAIYTGCVPVLISDHYVPPFSDVLNWKFFSVEVPVSKIPELKNILMGISPRQYIRMQRRLLQIRRHFEVNSPPKRFDVFHMILHSVWLRRLNVRVLDFV